MRYVTKKLVREGALKNLTGNYTPILEKNSTTGNNDTTILNAFSWKEKKIQGRKLVNTSNY